MPFHVYKDFIQEDTIASSSSTIEFTLTPEKFKKLKEKMLSGKLSDFYPLRACAGDIIVIPPNYIYIKFPLDKFVSISVILDIPLYLIQNARFRQTIFSDYEMVHKSYQHNIFDVLKPIYNGNIIYLDGTDKK